MRIPAFPASVHALSVLQLRNSSDTENISDASLRDAIITKICK